MIGTDRECLLTGGFELGKERCSIIRDHLLLEDSMDIRTKSKDGGTTYNIAVAKSKTSESDVQSRCSLALQ